ncbi:MAG: M1 family aminopeptidase [Sandaracinaceae bacterium]
MRALAALVLALLAATPASAQVPAGLRSADLAPPAAAIAAMPSYALEVDLDDTAGTFTVDERATFTNDGTAPLSSIAFRIWANASAPSPLVELVDRACDGCRIETPSASAIVVMLDRPLAPGATRTVHLRLRGRLRQLSARETSMEGAGLNGLGALFSNAGSDYGLLSVSEGVVSMSGFFAVLARRRAGRWELDDGSGIGDLTTDELASYRVRLRVRDGVEVVATGEEGPVRVVGDRTERDIEGALLRELAIVASPRLVHRDRDVGGVRVRSWFITGDETAGGQVLEAAAQALQTFERRFGPYPFRTLDVVEAPIVGGAGGVEFSSMVTVASMFYRAPSADASSPLGGLLSATQGPERRAAMLEFVTAHEVAHQYWHAVVGSDSRQHPVQDEALAQYSALLYVEDRYGAERARREADQQVLAGYHMMRLLGHPDAAADRPASAFDDMLSYGGIVYGKAPFLYVELRRRLGDRRFFSALRSYATDYRFVTAPPRALFDRMARGSHAARVRALVARWLDQAHGDDDLGQPDLGRMLGDESMDPQLRALLGSQLPALLGGADGGGAPDLEGLLRQLGGAGGADGVDPERLLQQLLGGSAPTEPTPPRRRGARPTR